MTHRLTTRREFAALSLATATALGMKGAFAQDSTPASPTGEWSFTDLEGTTITLPQAPTRIAANIVTAAALWDLGIKVTAVYDWTSSNYPDGDHIAWGNINPDEVIIIGNIGGNLEPEELAAAEIEVLFAQTFELGDPESTNGIPVDMYDTINTIAPVLIVTDMEAADVNVERIVALADSLGADLDAPEVVAMREAYEAKLEEFQQVTAEKSDILTLFINASASELYVAGPKDVSDLKFLGSLGLQFANIDAPAATEYWETLSAEQALLYPADVLYMDVYSTLKTADDLMAEPAFAAMPAAQAGQVGTWQRDYPASYEGVTGFLEEILIPLRDAEKVI
ncbi:MAG: ABC transporter substrate-binding protein [Thermomicrobiales bacterium]|nr:ABC transporter substrate-binding protein [Thermomicrobiales bacterium]